MKMKAYFNVRNEEDNAEDHKVGFEPHFRFNCESQKRKVIVTTTFEPAKRDDKKTVKHIGGRGGRNG
jgi:hypothetical protein